LTEGLQGVLIGGAIGIFGSLIVETIRAKYQRKENSKKYLIEILEKRKAALLLILEHFRKLHAQVLQWKAHPKMEIDITAQWDSLTGLMPHLAILPDPIHSFICEQASELNDRLLANETAGSTTAILPDIKALNEEVSGCVIKITGRIRAEILLIDAEILRSDGWLKKCIKKIKNKFYKQSKKAGTES
jgi:hypothetical protein